jgi:hypothetical protein
MSGERARQDPALNPLPRTFTQARLDAVALGYLGWLTVHGTPSPPTAREVKPSDRYRENAVSWRAR